jgi:hypothetical protein
VSYAGEQALQVTISYDGALPPGVTSPELVFDGYRAVLQNPARDPQSAGTVNRYVYLDAKDKPLTFEAAKAIAARRARLARLDAIQYQNAWSSLQITRNDLLVDGNPTRAPFIYATPWVSFRNKLAPRLVTDKAIAIEQVPTNQPQSRTLLEHLEALFATFFYQSAVDRQIVKLEVTYGYVPGGSAQLPAVVLPVLLVPASDVVISSKPVARARAAAGNELDLPQLAGAIKTWFGDNGVSRSSGMFNFALTAFSALELNTQPLVQVPALTLGLAYVKDL